MSSAPPTSAPSFRPSVAGKRFRFLWWALPLLGSTTLFVSLGFAILLQVPLDRTRARWEQPNNINYESHDPYMLLVVDRSSWWNESNRHRHCRIGVVSHVQLTPDTQASSSYGHWIEYEFQNYTSDPNYLTRCTIVWESEGVTITEPTGHKLFVPKKAFIGGR